MMNDGDRLREILRRHDPARGPDGLSEDEKARMRRAVVRAAGEDGPSGIPAGRLPGWAFAGILTALAIGGGLALWQRERPVAHVTHPAPATDAGLVRADAPARREVHIVTPGGTQVVWVLDPEFRL